MNQIKGMGCSCDYDDEHFTLEPSYVKAVRKLFVDWYRDDLIYKGKRIVNWCPHCTTSISDDEAEYVDEAGHLWYLRYPPVSYTHLDVYKRQEYPSEVMTTMVPRLPSAFAASAPASMSSACSSSSGR